MDDKHRVQLLRQKAIEYSITGLTKRDEDLLGLKFDASAHYLTMCERVIKAAERWLTTKQEQP